MTEANQSFRSESIHELSHSWGWLLGLGILLTITGAFAILAPTVASSIIELYVGWILMIAGICKIIFAMKTRNEGRTGWKALTALLYLATGFIFLWKPSAGIYSLTIFLGITFFAEGFGSFLI